MLHSSMFILTRDGYRSISSLSNGQMERYDSGCVTDPTVHRRPYLGEVVYIYTEQGDHPLICTPCQYLLTKSRGSSPAWTKAGTIGRGVYVGTPIPEKFEGYCDQSHNRPCPSNRETLLSRQLQCICSGVCRAVRSSDLDEESSRGDILFDEKYCWYKVHDVETSNEPGTFMYHTTVCIANNVCCVDTT